MATTVRLVIGSPSVTRASRAASTGATARMKRTRATLVWFERGDEAARGRRDAQRHSHPGEPDRAERLHDPPALHDRHVGQQRHANAAPRDLRRRVERQLALEDARRRPGHRGERNIDLAAPLVARLLERHRGRRAVK